MKRTLSYIDPRGQVTPYLSHFPAHSPLLLIENSLQRKTSFARHLKYGDSNDDAFPLQYVPAEGPRVSVRHSMYTKCMSLEMHYAIQLDGTFGVATLKLSLIFGESKVGFHVLLQDVFSRYVAHSSFVCELPVAYADEAYWVGEHHGIQTWTPNRLDFSALWCIRLLFYSLTTLTPLWDILKVMNGLPLLVWEKCSMAFKYHEIHLLSF